MASTGIESSGLNLWLREHRLAQRMRLANKKYSAFVLSIPKSGRTWNRLMLGFYLTRVLGKNPESALNLTELCRESNISLIAYSHNGTSFTDKLPPTSKLIASPTEWENRKVLLLIRDNRDVLVSAYFHCRYREKSFDGTISEYIRNPFVGILKLVTALNRWHKMQYLAKDVEILPYEDMHSMPISALKKTLIFAGIENPVDSYMDEAINFTRMENLQKLENANYFQSIEMQNKSGDPRARKVREGKIGGFREHLSADDIAYIDEMEQKIGNPYAYRPAIEKMG